MDKHISILLGSGFSIPAGYPSATYLNQVLSTVKAGNIQVHSSLDAKFTKTDSAGGLRYSEDYCSFVEALIQHYCQIVLQQEDTFDYEQFYDWYKQLERMREVPEEILSICKSHGREPVDLLHHFDIIFNQLIQDLLKGWPQDFINLEDLKKKYHNFSELLVALKGSSTLRIHTLNHDLLFEYYLEQLHSELHISDGFSLEGTPYFGRTRPNGFKNPIPIKCFTNNYTSEDRYYKLHGSIDHFRFHFEQTFEMVKLQKGMSHNDMMKKVIRNGQTTWLDDTTNFYPDFLSGTLNKIAGYESSAYYKAVMGHFDENLRSSKVLITVGYGFRDTRINEMIEKHLCSKDISMVLAISPSQPDHSMFTRDSVKHFPMSVTEISVSEILKLI